MMSGYIMYTSHAAVAALRAVPACMLNSTSVTDGSRPYHSLVYAVLWGKNLLSGSLVQIYKTPHSSREEKSCQCNLEQNLVLRPWTSNRMPCVYKLFFGKFCCVKG